MSKETFKVKYSCGCIHEIDRDTSKGGFMFQPTGKKEKCDYHKKVKK